MKDTKLMELKRVVEAQLSVGQVFNNYRHLCESLNEPVLEGNSKKGQLKKWRQLFDFDKVGHKHVIKELYELPLHESDDAVEMCVEEKARGRKLVYAQHVNKCLLNILAQSEDYSLLLSRYNWYIKLGLLSKTYKKTSLAQLNSELPESISDVSGVELSRFYANLSNKLLEVLNSSLRNLSKRGLIEWDYERFVHYPNGNVRKANNQDIQKHTKAKQYAKSKVGLEATWKIHLYGKVKEYHGYIDEYVNENYGWSAFYEGIRVKYTGENPPDKLSAKDIKQEQIQVRYKIAQSLEDSLIKKRNINQDKLDEKIIEFEIENDRPVRGVKEMHSIAEKNSIWIYADGYVRKYKFLIDYFIRGNNISGSDDIVLPEI